MARADARSILVTGGFGFIGSHLVEALLRYDPKARIHVVDDLSRSPINVAQYLTGIAGGERVTYDICPLTAYLGRSSLPAFTDVVHLAAVVGPVGVLKHGGEILRKTASDMYAVVDYARRTHARICDVSTSEVYGGGRDGYCSERDCMMIPPNVSIRLEYAVAKLACEVALSNLTAVSDFSATIVRPFNVAGPRQSPGGGFVLPRFIHQALAGEPLTVYGDGTMIRAFTHVRDLAEGILRVMERGKSGRVYNLGNPANKTTILDLAREVIRLTGSSSRIAFIDPTTLWGPLYAEANDKYPDARRAIEELGWRPRFSLADAIRDTATYIQAGRCD